MDHTRAEQGNVQDGSWALNNAKVVDTFFRDHQNEGVKYDNNKLRFDLIPPVPLFYLAEIFNSGAEKYGDRNWERGIKYSRIFSAMQRHLWKFWHGEDTDIESGLPHLAHVAWGAFALMQYGLLLGKELDDRPSGDGLQDFAVEQMKKRGRL